MFDSFRILSSADVFSATVPAGDTFNFIANWIRSSFFRFSVCLVNQSFGKFDYLYWTFVGSQKYDTFAAMDLLGLEVFPRAVTLAIGL